MLSVGQQPTKSILLHYSYREGGRNSVSLFFGGSRERKNNKIIFGYGKQCISTHPERSSLYAKFHFFLRFFY